MGLTTVPIMRQYRVRLLSAGESTARIRRRHSRRWVAKILDPKVGGFGHLYVTVLDGDLARQGAQGRVISRTGRRLKIRGTAPFADSATQSTAP
jgi:hypothetical protein